jgi:hypothetical protein
MSNASAPIAESAQLNCPACHHNIVYYNVKGSEYYACPHCHTYFKYTNEEQPEVLGHYTESPTIIPGIPLGALGTLAGHRWRMVGAAHRYEYRAQQYGWLEYQLFQPETGTHAQLAEYNGHWTIVWAAGDNAQPSENFRLADFQLYNRYQSRVKWAIGEFDWDIESDQHLTVSEYIRPPYMLVQEQQGKQQTWYRAEHVEPQAVHEAFGLPADALPTQQGIGAVQPSPMLTKWPVLRNITILAAGLLILAQLVLSALHPTEAVLTETLQVAPDATATAGTGKVLVSSSFNLQQSAAVEIDLSTNLNNQWLELPVSLVNEQTGRGFEFTRNLEFYSGVEDGESWTEGASGGDALLSAVPPGRYHLNLYPFTEAGSATLDITVTVKANPKLWSNFFLVLALLLVYPLWAVWRASRHTLRRWENSDFNPYQTEE